MGNRGSTVIGNPQGEGWLGSHLLNALGMDTNIGVFCAASTHLSLVAKGNQQDYPTCSDLHVSDLLRNPSSPMLGHQLCRRSFRLEFAWVKVPSKTCQNTGDMAFWAVIHRYPTVGVLFGCFGRKIDGPGLPGGLIVYQGHLFPLKGRLCIHLFPMETRMAFIALRG